MFRSYTSLAGAAITLALHQTKNITEKQCISAATLNFLEVLTQ